jgi:LuxR family transcriptional regulator, quorum-sensing system regulator CviR
MVQPHETSEFRSLASAGDALSLLEITHACISCTTEAEFKHVISRVQGLVPFDHMVAVSARLEPGGAVVASQRVNVSYPEEFCREYVSRDYFRVDPVMRDALATCRAQYCSDAMHGRPKEIMSLCADFGLREGYNLGSRSPAPGGGATLLAFKGRSMSHDRRSVDTLEFVAPHLHLACSRVLQGEDAAATQVSGREREVLQWLQQGKSSWEVSVILAISESTVNFHVSNIKRKLGATNRAQALAIAARLGLLRCE